MVARPAELEHFTIELGCTLWEALASLERSSSKIVVITDGNRRVAGLLTDGDIRRALLRGAALDAPVDAHMIRSFASVGPRTSRADVLDLMHARRIGEVPVLDADGHLLGLHRMHDVLAPRRRDNWAVVMAGGRGTRLAPLTHDVPKPMLRVAGRPILERIVLHLVGVGIERIFLAINYLGHVVEQHFGDGQHFGCRIEYLREDRALGTAGALSLLPDSPAAPLLVLNGDLVTQTDFGEVLDFHEAGQWSVTVGVRRYLHTVPFGCLELCGDRVTAIEEKPTFAKTINTGIYVLAPQVSARVPAGREYTMPEVLADSLARGEHVGGYEIVDDWVDIGQKEQLRRARGDEP